MFADTHCHLYLSQFETDLDAVMARARQAGLARVLVPAVDAATAERAIALARKWEEVYAAVGFHPGDLAGWDAGSIDRVRQLAAREKVVAIGEIGLDYHWDTHPRELQRDVFSAQLDLAAELGLPVVVHNRDATADVLDKLIAWAGGLRTAGNPLALRPGVMHAFSGDQDDAERALAAGFFIGIAGPVTFKNAHDLHSLAAALPLERLLIETDAPYLTPHPHRGKRNEPGHVRLVAEKLAELKGVSMEEVVQATYENSVRLFRW